MPQNYCIAVDIPHEAWNMRPDLAADMDIVLTATKVLMKYEYKYGRGEVIIAEVNRRRNTPLNKIKRWIRKS